MNSFSWALEQMKDGKKVRSNSWPEKHYVYIDFLTNTFMEVTCDGEVYVWTPSELLHNDWRSIS